MKYKIIQLTIFVAFSAIAVCGQGVVKASQVNGTWVSGENKISILALGSGQLKVDYYGTYSYKVDGQPTANLGTASGYATIKGRTAIFTAIEPEGCKMTFRFTATRLVVVNKGCQFGLNVNSTGTYKRTSAKKPVFDWA